MVYLVNQLSNDFEDQLYGLNYGNWVWPSTGKSCRKWDIISTQKAKLKHI